jgi:hypothetical protein
VAYIRWLYKSWNIFWTFIGVLVLTFAITTGVLFGLLQLKPVKDRIALEVQNTFSEQYQGIISIGEIGGMLPFNVQLSDVNMYADSASLEPVFQAPEMNVGVDVLSLFKKQLQVHSLEITEPFLVIDTETGQSIEKAFLSRFPDERIEASPLEEDEDFGLQIVIPSAQINDGNILVRNARSIFEARVKADSVHFSNVMVDVFFEYTEAQRFVDINTLQFDAPELNLADVQAFGQIYNDERFLELNAFNIMVDNSTIRISGEADGVNILEGGISQQFQNAQLQFIMDRMSIQPSYLSQLVPNAPSLPSNLNGMFTAEGTLKSLELTRAEFNSGESYTFFTGFLNNLSKPGQITYQLDLSALILEKPEVVSIFPTFTPSQQDAIAGSMLEGEFSGSLKETAIDARLTSNRGDIQITGNFNDTVEPLYNFEFSTDSLNLGGIVNSDLLTSSNLNMEGSYRSSSLNPREGSGDLEFTLGEGHISERRFDSLQVNSVWDYGIIEAYFSAKNGGATTSATANIDWTNTKIPAIRMEGEASQINVKSFFRLPELDSVVADFEYDLNVTGLNPDEMYGQVSLDVLEAITSTDTLGRHQVYLDLNKPGSDIRSLRFTSTALDATLEGDFDLGNISQLSRHWANYFSNRWEEEILFNDVANQRDELKMAKDESFSLNARIKNPNILRGYFPGLPVFESAAQINSTVNVNSERLLLDLDITDPKTRFNNFYADSLSFQLTSGFRSSQQIKEFSEFRLQGSSAHITYGSFEGRGFELAANLNQDSLRITNTMERFGDEASFHLIADGNFEEDMLSLNVKEFDLGTSNYEWRQRGTPTIQYNSDDQLSFVDFLFESGEQFIEINGTYSNSAEDSVNYNIQNVNLGEISQIINGRIDFGGILDGRFTTRTLTTVPTIQGDIDIMGFNLNENLFGDIQITSAYDPQEDRFNTRLIADTDSTKYPEYYANNDRRGQKFQLDGYVLAPDEGDFPAQDTLYNFDVDFENVDLWILPILGPKVFVEGAGQALGTGKIWGNAETYDFTSDFMVGSEDAAYIKPQFLETFYYAQGELEFNKNDGFVFKDIYLIDPSGGSAILSGFYDLNNFSETNIMDIDLEMEAFQFLNSSFDPTVAFYGTAYGSGLINISGTNLAPVLNTVGALEISDFSEISIPLLEETDFNEDNRFIRFVSSFDDFESGNRRFSTVQDQQTDEESQMQEEDDLTFAERFTLDLQFVSNDPMTVRLIFDPVTGDIVTADGTGRIRILLDDQEVSMFGRFDIEGGLYQFVSGDIFTRRFEIESGGSITWEGDPANARLDVNAIYSARPDINTLSTGTRNPDNAQRVPVDLVLNIGGTLTSIENDFFFRLPNTFESQQSSTLSTQLASINRDDDLKLIQAANFMLMGDFIPVSATGETQANIFGDNISGGAAVLNPLLSSQVINPLLSNQVNSLLNSDLGSLDVDFNLNTYNQVDLGVALRLYNDRLILRREGQITGRQSNIGDLGATYQINRTFAVTAFHRQDLTFGTLSSTEQSQQSQDINGVGVEAQVSFNTWEEFFDRLLSPFRKLFGVETKEEEQEELTENKSGNNPA